MTGYTVHTGSNEKFTEGWDNIFDGPAKSSTARTSGGKNRTVKKTVKKTVNKKANTGKKKAKKNSR